MRVFWSLAPISCALLLSGCSVPPVLTSSGSTSGSVRGAAITGKVHGGQNTISGAHVYLLAANNTGYGGPGIAASGSNASVSLLTTGTGQDSLGHYVTTGSDGSFSISGDYTCPSSYAVPYLYVVGGNAGSGANSAITLIGPVGSCPTSSEFVVVNEVSTVAAVYAFAGFASGPTNVSSSNAALAAKGMNNAGETVSNLVTASTGVANTSTPGGNGTVPQAMIDTLANILAACINSNGAVSGPANPTPCYTLFTNALSGGATGTQPADTATAALNIAHNPGANVGNLFALQGSSPPFIPDLPTAPNDFTISISYTGGGLDSPWGIAVSANDDIWVAGGTFPGFLSEFDPVGTPITSSAGITGNGLGEPYGIAIDGNGYIWVPSGGTNALSSFTSTGTAVTSTTSGGLESPEGIAIDGSNNVWVVNSFGNSLTEFSTSNGTPSTVTGDPFGSTVLVDPFSLAVDIHGNAWVADRAGVAEIVEFSSSGSASSPYTGGGLGEPISIAFDPSGNAWIADDNNAAHTSALSEFNSTGGAISTTGFGGGGLDEPWGIAVDSNGNIWVSNVETSHYSISEFNSSGDAVSPIGGYQSSSLSVPYYLAIDGSGNLWAANFGSSSPGTITEFVGIASPVVTPIAANLQSPYGTAAVNKP